MKYPDHLACGPAPYWASCHHCQTASNPLELQTDVWIPMDRLLEFLETFARHHADCKPPFEEEASA